MAEPLIFRHLKEMERAFSGGFLISRAAGTDSRSPRPLSGPEPNDMVRVLCTSCDARFKLMEGWADPVFCPGCFIPLVLT